MCLITQSTCVCLRPHGLQPARLLCPWGSPSQNTEVGRCSLIPGDLPNRGIKPRSPTLQMDSLLDCVTREAQEYWSVYPFSRGSSQPRSITVVSCIAGGFFTSWATEAAPVAGIAIWKWAFKGSPEDEWCWGNLASFEKILSWSLVFI